MIRRRRSRASQGKKDCKGKKRTQGENEDNDLKIEDEDVGGVPGTELEDDNGSFQPSKGDMADPMVERPGKDEDATTKAFEEETG